MKCYYATDPKTLKKVFIPMCWGTVHSFNIEDCCCGEPLTEYKFNNKRFQEAILAKNRSIEAMQSEIKNLNKIILNLKK